MLETINSPEDIKKLSQVELSQLAKDIRAEIIKTVGKNGGHLASNLGVVELTIALHRVFNSPKDAIIWDVSHQCYAHKLITGRYNNFSTLRLKDGISGFTNPNESPHDYFINGHSSTSISSALGLLVARNLSNNSDKVIAVIGDGALTGGMAFEALSNGGQLNKNLIVILNDNQMSIDHNTGSVSRYLSRLSMSSQYQTFRYHIDKAIDHIPYFNKYIEKFIFRFKRSLKGLFLTNNLFTDLGFEYVGPLDGHNEGALEAVLKKITKLHRPVVVHVVTKKGRGYKPAEVKPENYHGVSPFLVESNDLDNNSNENFTKAFGNIILDIGEKNKELVCITAAMAQGTGLSDFASKFPERFFDVGIAEEHAVTFAGGLAVGGKIPVCCIYSTFIQRAVDQIIHDIALQKVHAIFVLDRAGPVPSDGVTHQGIFDISLFRPVPNLQILSPATKKDLELCTQWAVDKGTSVIIRYPKCNLPKDYPEFSNPLDLGKGVYIKSKESSKNKCLIVSTGGMLNEVNEALEKIKIEKNISCDIYSLRFIKPFDNEYFLSIAKNYSSLLFVEDGIKIGGISQDLFSLLPSKLQEKSKILAFEDKFYSQGTRKEVLESAGLSTDFIEKSILELLKC